MTVCNKHCPRCGEIKLASEFSPSKREKSGLRCWCRKCNSNYNKRYNKGREEYQRKYQQEHRDRRRELTTLRRAKEKVEVLTHYGYGKLACVRCGFEDIRALSIDHIRGGGGQHNKEIGGHIYYWLKVNSFPGGYQTLCMNCQWLKKEEDKEERE